MNDDLLLQTIREALILVAMVAAPPVLGALVVGLLVGVVQAITQVQDQALSLAFRICAVFGALLIMGPWIFDRVGRFGSQVLALLELA